MNPDHDLFSKKCSIHFFNVPCPQPIQQKMFNLKILMNHAHETVKTHDDLNFQMASIKFSAYHKLNFLNKLEKMSTFGIYM